MHAHGVSHVPVSSRTDSDNVLFGRPYDPTAFARTLEACCMVDDVASMSNGDLTLVGTYGAMCSRDYARHLRVTVFPWVGLT